jgi:hypothetical protein
MKKTILPFGAHLACAALSISLIFAGCSKHDSQNNPADDADDDRLPATEFTVATANGFAAGIWVPARSMLSRTKRSLAPIPAQVLLVAYGFQA